MTNIERAQNFAHRAYDSIGQVRKYSGEPYWVHTDEVANTVTCYDGTEKMIIASHLHDVVEDVNKNGFDRFAILREFGHEVLDLVNQLTDEYTSEKWPNENRATRKCMEAIRLATISIEAKTIKLADLLSNTRSIVDNDPNFAKTYLREKAAILPGLKGGDDFLHARVEAQLQNALDKLGIKL
jgi:(p)ppGpp synthase/HD superfamily hydrolase